MKSLFWLAVCAAVLVAASAGAQPRPHGARPAASMPAAERSCAGSVCVEAVERGDTVSLRARNDGTSTREVRVTLLVVNGYENRLGSQATVTVAPGAVETAMVLVPAPPRGGRPRGYRYIFEAQRPFGEACLMGVCLRSERTERALTISVHNTLAVPLVVGAEIEGAASDTVRVEGGSVREVHTTWARAVMPRNRLLFVQTARPPDTTVAYRLPLDGAQVETTGLPADVLARYVRDTTVARRRTVRQNRHVYRFHTGIGVDVRAARSGIVVEVVDSLRDIAIDRSPALSALDSLVSVETDSDGARIEVRRRAGGGINSLFVRHDDGTTARDLGLRRSSAAVAVGDTVAVGDRLGAVGADARLSFSVVEFTSLQTTIPVWVQTRGQAARRLREGETAERGPD